MASKRRFQPKTTAPSVSLHATRGEYFYGDLHQRLHGQCEVTAVVARTTAPVADALVRYRVVRGPVRFAGNRVETEVRTDTDGRAAVSLSFVERGTGFIEAQLASGHGNPVYFDGHSDQQTHTLFVYASPTYPADPGIVRIRMMAIDHNEWPVASASLALFALRGRDEQVAGRVESLGGGEYEGEVRLPAAGEWSLSASDSETKITAHRCVWVLPGRPAQIRLEGLTDARRAPPFDEVLLRARLEDGLGNALDPHRIRARIAGRWTEPDAIVGDEARFRVGQAGYGPVHVAISDAESDVRHETTIMFASAWLGDPGLVLVDESFSTPVYWVPPVDRPVAAANIRIRSEELARFATFTPAEDAPVRIEHSVEAGVVSIGLAGEKPIHATEFPDGIYLGTCRWDCMGEGRTCFVVSAAMSSSTPGWELCVEQKRKAKKCICVNVLYLTGDANGPAAVAAASRIADVISQLGNVERCCPVVTVEVHDSPISNADWTANIAPHLVGGAVPNPGQQAQLLDEGFGQRTRCMTFLIVPYSFGVGLGNSYTPAQVGGRARGFGLMSPRGLAADANLAAHEAGHQLGLDDVVDRQNLMGPGTPSAVNLTDVQCRTIWENLSRYPC